MPHRPLSVSIVGWFLIVTALLSLILLPYTLSNSDVLATMDKGGLPGNVQLGISLAGSLVTLLCGFFILKGRDWARLAIVAWVLLGIGLGLATSAYRPVLLISLLYLLVLAFFLFRPAANRFFGRSWFGSAD